MKLKSYPLYNFNGRLFFPIEKEYLNDIKNWRNAQMNILRQWKPLTELNQEEWFQKISKDNNQTIFMIMMYDKKDELYLIGYCGLTNVDFINRRGEISFLVNPERVKNKNLYREDFISTLYMLCEYGFKEINLHKLFTETFSFRREHIEILENFGFHRDGILREHQYINGEYHHSVIHSMLKEEYYKKDKRREKW